MDRNLPFDIHSDLTNLNAVEHNSRTIFYKAVFQRKREDNEFLTVYFRYTFLSISAAVTIAAKAAISERPTVTGCSPMSLFMESAFVVILPMSVSMVAPVSLH